MKTKLLIALISVSAMALLLYSLGTGPRYEAKLHLSPGEVLADTAVFGWVEIWNFLGTIPPFAWMSTLAVLLVVLCLLYTKQLGAWVTLAAVFALFMSLAYHNPTSVESLMKAGTIPARQSPTAHCHGTQTVLITNEWLLVDTGACKLDITWNNGTIYMQNGDGHTYGPIHVQDDTGINHVKWLKSADGNPHWAVVGKSP